MKRTWKRGLLDFTVNGDWTEAENADGSVTYTASGPDADAEAMRANGTIQSHPNCPPGTAVTYWPDTGKLRVVWA